MLVVGLSRVRKPGLVAARVTRKIAPSNTPFIRLFVDPVVPCGVAAREDHGWTPSTSRHHSTIHSQLDLSGSACGVVPGTGGAVRVITAPSADRRRGRLGRAEVQRDPEGLVVPRGTDQYDAEHRRAR